MQYLGSIDDSSNLDTDRITGHSCKGYILSIGLLLCGVVFTRQVYDNYLTIRSVIWCVTAIALLLFSNRIKFNCAMLVLLACCVFSGIFAINKAEWIYSASRLFLVMAFISSIDIDIKIVSKTMMILGAIFVVVFWCERAGWIDTDLLMGQQNYSAASLFLVIPFCFTGQWKKFGMVLAIALAVNIFMSGSKGSMLALVVCVSLLNRKWFIVSLLATMLLVIIRMDTIPDSIMLRIVQWKPTVVMIMANPFGVGAGNFVVQFPNYARGMIYPDAFHTTAFRFPHNDYLWICSEIGVLGLSAWLWMIVSSIKSASKPIMIGIVGYLVISMFTSLNERVFTSIVFAVMIGVSMPRTITLRHTKCIALVLLFVLVVFGFRLNADYHFNQAKMHREPERIVKAESWFSTLSYTGAPYKTGIYTETHDYKDALKAYTLNPYNIQTLNMMGIAHERIGRPDRAKWCYVEALDICSDYKDAQINLQRLNYGN